MRTGLGERRLKSLDSADLPRSPHCTVGTRAGCTCAQTDERDLQPFASDVGSSVAAEVLAATAMVAVLDSQARLQPKAVEGSLDRPRRRKEECGGVDERQRVYRTTPPRAPPGTLGPASSLARLRRMPTPPHCSAPWPLRTPGSQPWHVYSQVHAKP